MGVLEGAIYPLRAGWPRLPVTRTPRIAAEAAGDCQHAHSLDLEAGGKAYILGGGMDETTGVGLMKDVRNIIGAETWS